ncbi:hypothetical protein [Sulfurisphaera tokodaii]|uniref:Uncharacterized protein n=1 Tax=Sulfurisphaera tokodaii TaxID=111955 RepID=A0A832TPS6_9CREN|nr:hypothetical protein [Sulfurisphaera tokodaii]HII73333.1 hypothetical protein [Sulfurisphaera tokodaii]
MILVIDNNGNILATFSNEEDSYNFVKEKMKEGKKIRIIPPAQLYMK